MPLPLARPRRPFTSPLRLAALAPLALGLLACRSTAPATAPAAIRTTDAPAALPPIPEVRGPVAIRVIYPSPGALIAARDSTFLLGTVGTGDAALTINGARVDVRANGAFLAWLPVPRQPRYELVAARPGDTARVTLPVRLLPTRPALAAGAPLAVDSASVAPGAGLVLRANESVRVAIRASADATATLLTPGGTRRPLARGAPGAGGAGAIFSTDLAASQLVRGGEITVARGAERLTRPVPPVAVLDSAFGTLALLGEGHESNPDRVVVGRPVPGGTYRWFFLPGTVVPITGQSGTATRVRLDSGLEVWVESSEVTRLPTATAAPRRTVANVRVQPAAEWVDVIFPMADRPPFQVQEEGSTLVLTLYDTRPNTDIITFAANDSLVRHVTWDAERTDRARYTLHLPHAPFGYQALWREGAFILRVRRMPEVDERAPLRGLRIAVDAGHPPAGSTGPTGLYEAVPALAISRRVEALLEARGAEVLMTRTTETAVPLGDRPAMARQANAHALVSIHLNALPDGINPYTANGTGTYYFHPRSAALARAVQHGMVRYMGLRNLGIFYDNLALVRPTWMPSVLCEGAFMMIPEQEAALRTAEFQERYALGVVEGLEEYFRGLADAQRAGR